MEPIKITPTGQKVVDKTLERIGERTIIEETGVDQFGKPWHRFHSQLALDTDKLVLNPATSDDVDGSKDFTEPGLE